MTAKDGRQRQGRRSTMALAKTGCVAHLWDYIVSPPPGLYCAPVGVCEGHIQPPSQQDIDEVGEAPAPPRGRSGR